MAFEIIVFLDIAILLIFAKIFGEIAERLHMSQLFGEVVAGIFLGVIGIVTQSEFLSELVPLGIIFLFFIIGMEIKIGEKQYGFISLVSSVISFLVGFGVGIILFDLVTGFIIGLALASTSTIVSLHSYINVGQLRTSAHSIVIEINNFNEIIAIIAVTLLTAGIAFQSLSVVIAAVVGILIFVVSKISKQTSFIVNIFRDSKDLHLLTITAIILMFLVSFVAEYAGIAFAGAFLAGLAISKASAKESNILPNMKTIGFGFFIPLFFAYSALAFDITQFISSLWIILVLLVAAAGAKVIGTLIPANFFHRKHDSLLAAIGMIPRGEYAIIIAHVALFSSIITPQIYTIIVAFALLSMIITPLLLTAYMKKL